MSSFYRGFLFAASGVFNLVIHRPPVSLVAPSLPDIVRLVATFLFGGFAALGVMCAFDQLADD